MVRVSLFRRDFALLRTVQMASDPLGRRHVVRGLLFRDAWRRPRAWPLLGLKTMIALELVDVLTVVRVQRVSAEVSAGPGRITEKPRTRGGLRRKRDGRRRLVSVRGSRRRRRRPVQEPDVLVEMRMVGHGRGLLQRRGGRTLHAPDERVDQERPGHGFLGGRGHRDGRTTAGTVHPVRAAQKTTHYERTCG